MSTEDHCSQILRGNFYIKDKQMYDNSIRKEINWRIYNLAFRIFGKTQLWPKLGIAIWK